VKGKGGKHDEGSATQAEDQPAKTRRKFERGIGCAPVPGRQTEEKNSRGKGEGSPDEQIEEGKGEVDETKTDQEGETGGVVTDPTGNPGVTGPVGNSQNEGGGEKKPGGKLVGYPGEGKAGESKEDRKEPRKGRTQGKGHRPRLGESGFPMGEIKKPGDPLSEIPRHVTGELPATRIQV